MSTRFELLTARRRLLQAECAVQRGEIGALQAEFDAGAARADHIVAVVRRLTPLLLAAGAVALVVAGPGRALSFGRQALAVALAASRAARLLR
jgi:hypothetical protein